MRSLGVYLFIVCLLSAASPLLAQTKAGKTIDSNYYKSYDTMFTTRVYLTQKYLSLVISGDSIAKDIKYRPNSKLNMGLGITYGWFTLNLGFALGLLNNGDDGKGKTKSLDLQLHSYGRKISVDLLFQQYKGMYLYPQGTAAVNNDQWYVRPDIKLLQIGASAYYATNWRRFSYRAALLQNEWQTKSAGSFLLGAQVFYGRTRGDSALVPAVLEESYQANGVKQISYGSIAPGAGYAYTLVIARHWFANAGIVSRLSFQLLTETRETDKSTLFSVRPNFTYKGAIGYNSRRFTTSISGFNNSLGNKSNASNYRFESGNVRLDVAYRFRASPKAKKKLRFFRHLDVSNL